MVEPVEPPLGVRLRFTLNRVPSGMEQSRQDLHQVGCLAEPQSHRRRVAHVHVDLDVVPEVLVQVRGEVGRMNGG